MRFKDKFVRTVERTLRWKSSPAHERYADRQNSPPDEQDADSAEEREANESGQLEAELVSGSGARAKSAQSKG